MTTSGQIAPSHTTTIMSNSRLLVPTPPHPTPHHAPPSPNAGCENYSLSPIAGLAVAWGRRGRPWPSVAGGNQNDADLGGKTRSHFHRTQTASQVLAMVWKEAYVAWCNVFNRHACFRFIYSMSSENIGKYRKSIGSYRKSTGILLFFLVPLAFYG